MSVRDNRHGLKAEPIGTPRVVLGELAQRYVARATCSQTRALRIRRLLAVVGQLVLGLRVVDVARALGCDHALMSREMPAVLTELREEADALGVRPEHLFPSTRGEEDDDAAIATPTGGVLKGRRRGRDADDDRDAA